MTSQPLITTSKLALGLLISAMTFAAPASAERWQAVENSTNLNVRLDMDSLQRHGSQVTYRAEFTKAHPNPASKTTRSVSVAVIDCDRRQRKGLETEQFMFDGSSHKGSIDLGWRAIKEGTLTEKIEQMICVQPS